MGSLSWDISLYLRLVVDSHLMVLVLGSGNEEKTQLKSLYQIHLYKSGLISNSNLPTFSKKEKREKRKKHSQDNILHECIHSSIPFKHVRNSMLYEKKGTDRNTTNQVLPQNLNTVVGLQ